MWNQAPGFIQQSSFFLNYIHYNSIFYNSRDLLNLFIVIEMNRSFLQCFILSCQQQHRLFLTHLQNVQLYTVTQSCLITKCTV